MDLEASDNGLEGCGNDLELAEIEDLISDNQGELLRSTRRLGPHVTARTKRKVSSKRADVNSTSNNHTEPTETSDTALETNNLSANGNVECFLPGTQRIFAKTWGCTHNTSDTEFMMGLLAQAGYSITESQAEADLWLLNSCTVKDPAEAHFRNEVLEGRRLGKYIVVAGCVPQAAPNLNFLNGLSAVGVQQIDRIVEVVEETLRGNSVRLYSYKRTNKGDAEDDGDKKSRRKAGGASLSMPKIRRNPLIEIIPISTGCLNQCTYCKTRHARGELGSYTPNEIIGRAKQALSEGVREIWLTSEDTGAYGRDIGSSLSQLLDGIVNVLPDDAMLRIGMTNPPYVMEQIDALARALSHPQVYSFVHIPVQSGSDNVLNDMKREYTVAQFRELCDALRKQVPGVTIATDLICAFPTETEADFSDTLKLVQDYEFPVLFINQFYARAGTPAARMRRECTPRDAKRRTREAHDAFMRYNPLADRVGREYKVLVTDSSFDGRYFVAHNKSYEQILLAKEEAYLGGWFDVQVTETSKFSMKAKVLRTLPLGRPLPAAYGSQADSDVKTTVPFTKITGGEDNYAETDWKVSANGTSFAPSCSTDQGPCGCDCSCGDASNGSCCSNGACSHPDSASDTAYAKKKVSQQFGFAMTHVYERTRSYLGALRIRLPTKSEVKTTVEISWIALLVGAISVRAYYALRHRR